MIVFLMCLLKFTAKFLPSAVMRGKVAAAVNLKQNSDLVAAREASVANRYKI